VSVRWRRAITPWKVATGGTGAGASGLIKRGRVQPSKDGADTHSAAQNWATV